jgi:hypothetical protein
VVIVGSGRDGLQASRLWQGLLSLRRFDIQADRQHVLTGGVQTGDADATSGQSVTLEVGAVAALAVDQVVTAGLALAGDAVGLLAIGGLALQPLGSAASVRQLTAAAA